MLQVITMDESLEAFLTRLNLSQYFDNFREAGFDDLETVVTLLEEELEQSVGIVLPGHKRKLSLNFEKLRQPATSSQSSQSSYPQLGNPRKSLQAKLTFKSGKLTAEFPKEPSDPEVPWKRFMIPQPRFPRQHFFKAFFHKSMSQPSHIYWPSLKATGLKKGETDGRGNSCWIV